VATAGVDAAEPRRAGRRSREGSTLVNGMKGGITEFSSEGASRIYPAHVASPTMRLSFLPVSPDEGAARRLSYPAATVTA